MNRYLKIAMNVVLAISATSIVCLSLGSTGSQAKVLHVPLLDQCKKFALEELDRQASNFDYSFSYKKLDYVPDSHKDFTGFVELRSDSLSKTELLIMVNRFMVYCNPTSSTSFNIAESSYRKILEHIDILREQGAQGKIYIELEESDIVLRYQNLE